MESPLKVGSIGNVIKKDLYKSPERIYQQFDAKYDLYKFMDMTQNDAFEKTLRRELIMFENRQMLEYRIRRDYTNQLSHSPITRERTRPRLIPNCSLRFGETNFHITKECSRAFNICFGLPKNSYLTGTLSEVLVRLKESGIIQKFFKDEMDRVAQVADDSQSQNAAEPLTLDQLQGAFICYMIAAGFCVFVFLTEILGSEIMSEANNLSRPRGKSYF